MSAKTKNGIFHPFIASFFPPLSLYLHNVGKLYFWDAIKPVVLTLIAVPVFWWGSQRVLKDRARSAMVTILAFLMFFSFGHFTGLLERGLASIWPAFVATLTTRSTLTVLAIIWLGLWLLVGLLALRARLNFDMITQPINVFSLAPYLSPALPVAVTVINSLAISRQHDVEGGFGMLVCIILLVNLVAWSHYLTLTLVLLVIAGRRLLHMNFSSPLVLSFFLISLLLWLPRGTLNALILATGGSPEGGLTQVPFAVSLLSLMPAVAILGLAALLWRLSTLIVARS